LGSGELGTLEIVSNRGGRSGPVIWVLRNSGTRKFGYPQKLGSGYPIYPKSIIKIYTQTHIIFHRLVVCVEFQLQVEKNNII
jgi:hypothetical protein